MDATRQAAMEPAADAACEDPLTSMSPATVRPRRRWLPRRRRTWALLILGSLIAALLAVTILASTAPAWYDPPSISDPNIDLSAERAQARFVQLANMVHNAAYEDQTWTITDAEINAWLAVTYRGATTRHASDNTPPDRTLTGPMVRFMPGRVLVAARTTKAPALSAGGGVVSAALSFDVRPTTMGGHAETVGVLYVDGMWLGALPVPRSVTAGHDQRLVSEAGKAFRQARAYYFGATSRQSAEESLVEERMRMALAGEPFPLTFPSGHRQVQIKSVRIEAGRITVTFGPPGPATATAPQKP